MQVAIWVRKHAVAVALVVLPASLVDAAVRVGHAPRAVLHALLPLAAVDRLVGVEVHAHAVAAAVLPVACVDAALGSQVDAVALSLGELVVKGGLVRLRHLRAAARVAADAHHAPNVVDRIGVVVRVALRTEDLCGNLLLPLFVLDVNLLRLLVVLVLDGRRRDGRLHQVPDRKVVLWHVPRRLLADQQRRQGPHGRVECGNQRGGREAGAACDQLLQHVEVARFDRRESLRVSSARALASLQCLHLGGCLFISSLNARLPKAHMSCESSCGESNRAFATLASVSARTEVGGSAGFEKHPRVARLVQLDVQHSCMSSLPEDEPLL
mmetsp:Transcript_17875/g.38638  ORF Transcript_17875/g.38638 Transcript_17875/m.38638 type:complete len:325 (-) Transcript_17875:354-1328(-)